MKKIIVALSLSALAFASCVSSAPAAKGDSPIADAKKSAPKYEVVDYKGKDIGLETPEWVTVFVSDGITSVEALPKFKDKTVFVSEDTGSNLPGLKLWVSEYNVNKDIAKMVSTRVQLKGSAAAAGSPDTEVGRYLESVVKTTSDATFSGARKENDFWVLKRYLKADGSLEREEYTVYILVTIDKASFKAQLEAVISGVKPAKAVTKEQQTAIDRVKESFYEGF